MSWTPYSDRTSDPELTAYRDRFWKQWEHPQWLQKINDMPNITVQSIIPADPTHLISWVPFQWNDEGFIVRRLDDNKFYCLAINGVVVKGGCHDPLLRSAMWKRYTFWSVVRNVGTRRLILIGWQKPLHALSCAYDSPWFTEKTAKMDNLRTVNFQETRMYKILKPVVDIIEDREYNWLVGAVCPKNIYFDDLEYSKQYPAECEEDDLYIKFREYMDNTLKQQKTVRRSWGSNSNSVGSLEVKTGEELLLRLSKRKVDFDYVTACVDANGFPPLCTRFPKSGCVTSSGKVRSIYPMNILYENVLRRYFGDVKAAVPFTVARGRDFGPPMSNFYDMRQCDRQLLPVLSRYARERGVPWLIPYVVDPLNKSDKDWYYINQFPSGVYHTSIVTVCYTAAFLSSIGITDAVIQGDGFMCNETVVDTRVRTSTDFNGFRHNGKIWYYARPERLNEGKYDRGAGPKGVMRYLISYWAYEKLDADVGPCKWATCRAFNGEGIQKCKECLSYTKDGEHWDQLVDREKCWLIEDLYSDVGNIVKTAMRETVGEVRDLRKSNWDTHKLKEVQGVRDVGKDRYPRFFVEME